MNVFEDLIGELQEENLLELTVIDSQKKDKKGPSTSDAVELTEESSHVTPHVGLSEENADAVTEDAEGRSDDSEIEGDEAAIGELETAVDGDIREPSVPKHKPKPPKKRVGKEYFNKRAVDEVSSHQMVEHILTGVEREYMKVVPKTFDDFNAKKALHTFVNIAENSNSEEHKAAEFALMQETEAWGLALLERDNKIPVSHIRHYCENSKPALSSQAMLALARFYRNAPYSETIRAKFDFVITRLFSRPVEHDRRICLFNREEITDHITTLYSDWSSIPLYSAEDDDSKVLLTGLSFEEIAVEAENAASFDQLIEGDFFGRLRLFKESLSELFYEPSVTAAAVESNIRIGNAYVDLIVRERQKMDAASIQSKYSEFNDQKQSFSDAAGRTLDLAGLLNELTDEVINAETAVETESDADSDLEIERSTATRSEPKPQTTAAPIATQVLDNVRRVNRGVLIVAIIGILIAGSLYVWSTYLVDDRVSSAGVASIDLDGILAEHIKDGRIAEESLSAVLLPSWDSLSKEKREEYLQKVYQLGATKGYKKVGLLSKDGKPAGYASNTKIEVYMP